MALAHQISLLDLSGDEYRTLRDKITGIANGIFTRERHRLVRNPVWQEHMDGRQYSHAKRAAESKGT